MLDSHPELSTQERLRYSRHLILPEVGPAGQEKLRLAKVLVIGAGGLGSPVVLYLAAAGVGRIGIVDFDAVDLSNLQRQIIYTNDDVGKPKARAAAEHAGALNPNIYIVEHQQRLTAENVCDLIRDYDLVVDGTDNFA